MRGFAHPDQEFMYCYNANRELLEQYIAGLPECRGFQMNPMCRVRKNYIEKVRVSQVKAFFVST
jgi:hypothetical protein